MKRETLTQVVEARAKATSVNVNAGDLSPEKIRPSNRHRTSSAVLCPACSLPWSATRN
ncbi:MAG: hypothetical protein R2818_10605 [Flavobacteriales bacterium]